MTRFEPFRAGLPWAALALSACLSTDVGPVGPQVAGTVDGRVLKQNGSPVVGPAVLFTVTSLPVNGTSKLLSQLQLIAGDDGRFTASFIVDGDPQDAEVHISVTPPIGSQLLAVDSLHIPLKLGSSYPPRDTTYVELTLPPRP